MEHTKHHWNTYRCPSGCDLTFPSIPACKEHMVQSHPAEGASAGIDALITLNAQPINIRRGVSCPLCGDILSSLRQYQKHVGRHQEQLALFALPDLELWDVSKHEVDHSAEMKPLDSAGQPSGYHGLPHFATMDLPNADSGIGARISPSVTYSLSNLGKMSPRDADTGVGSEGQPSRQHVQPDLNSGTVPGRDGPFSCLWPACNAGPFKRTADLQRHFRNTHASEIQVGNYRCDYPRCARSGEPFNRRDFFRDHLREYHREDIPKKRGVIDDDWLESRYTPSTWWRCERCLVRIYLSKHGFECPICNTSLDEKRKRRRQGNIHGVLKLQLQSGD